MASDENNTEAGDTPDYPRHTPGQAEGTVEDVEGGGSTDSEPKTGVNPKKPSQAEGAPEDVEDSAD